MPEMKRYLRADEVKNYLRTQDSWMTMGLLLTLAATILVFTLRSPFFLTVDNFLNIGSSISVRGFVAIGLTIVIISGGLDLSVGAVAAVAGIVLATLIKDGVDGPTAALLAMLVAAGLGAINAFLIVVLRISPIIATLGTLLLFRGFAYVVSSGSNVVTGSSTFSGFGRGELLGVPNTLIVFLVLMALAIAFMRYTVVGNRIFAVGSNSEACRSVGIRVDRIRAGCYVAQALLAGLAGIALVSQTGSALPMALTGAELDIITAVLLGGAGLTGGRGKLTGTLIGLLIIGVIANGMVLLGIQVYWQQVIRGTILIVAVALDSARRGGGYR